MAWVCVVDVAGIRFRMRYTHTTTRYVQSADKFWVGDHDDADFLEVKELRELVWGAGGAVGK